MYSIQYTLPEKLLISQFRVDYSEMSRKMLIVSVVFTATSIVLSSAQGQPGSAAQCEEVSNATFTNSDRDMDTVRCAEAYGTLFFNARNATDQQKMMVCNAGQCNSMLKNVADICRGTRTFTVSYTRIANYS